MSNEINKNTIWLNGYDAATASVKTYDRSISMDVQNDLEDLLSERIRIEWVKRDFSMTLDELFVVRSVEENERGTEWEWSIKDKKTGHLVGSGVQSTKFRAAFECEGHSF